MTNLRRTGDPRRPYGHSLEEGSLDPHCQLDLPNEQLPYTGLLLGVNSLFYAYGLVRSGRIITAWVSAVHHVASTNDLPAGWGEAYSTMEQLAVRTLQEGTGVQEYTIFSSYGRASGQLTLDHLYWQIDSRPPGEWATGMTPLLLRREGNMLAEEHDKLLIGLTLIINSLPDEQAERLRELVRSARQAQFASIDRQPLHRSKRSPQ